MTEQEFKIPLQNEKGEIVDYALVDECNHEEFLTHTWYKNKDGYAYSIIDGKEVLMHELVYYKHKFMQSINNGNRSGSKPNVIDLRGKSMEFIIDFFTTNGFQVINDNVGKSAPVKSKKTKKVKRTKLTETDTKFI